ncbi:preprotein translocase subunit SecE [Phenylobacterium sp.]|uniref:preprotein translocase subunit SecE n=1 Tax=Phenylobacterium sp. TaxID=1871053 RepID=UPI0031BD46BE|nr:preprotein translocase subunit SecE [Phenylobacterium sp.]MCW5558363.1 preprotein translocase subunit SecE [Verrucomicrobiae bacterium]
MARKPSPQAMRERAAKTAAVMATPGGAVAAPKKTGLIEGLRNLPKFAMEVRAEARKITWTSRKETWITSVMVAIMVVLAAFFFFVVNWLLNTGITMILKLATSG